MLFVWMIPFFPSIKKKNKIGFFLRAGAIAPKGKHVFHITFAVYAKLGDGTIAQSENHRPIWANEPKVRELYILLLYLVGLII